MSDDLAGLGILRCTPAPSDAELEAERDAKHERELKDWFAEVCECLHGYHEGLCNVLCWDQQLGYYDCHCNRFRAGT